jgi:hypothetical protein
MYLYKIHVGLNKKKMHIRNLSFHEEISLNKKKTKFTQDTLFSTNIKEYRNSSLR